MHKHMSDILNLAATQDVTPDIDELVKAKGCQVSGVKLTVGNPTECSTKFQLGIHCPPSGLGAEMSLTTLL